MAGSDEKVAAAASEPVAAETPVPAIEQPPKQAARIVSFNAEPEVVCTNAGSDTGEPEEAVDAESDEASDGESSDDESAGSYESGDDSEDDEEGDENAEALAAGLSEMPKGLLANLVSGGKLGEKPLHHAAASNDVETLKKLLDQEYAGSIDDLDPFNYTALHVAVESGSKAAVSFLLKHSADAEKQTKMHMSRPLHYASFGGHAEICKALLDAGCDPDARTDDLRTPLYQASFRGHADCVKILLDAAADRAVKAKDGKLAVDVAANDAVRELLEQPPRKKPRKEGDAPPGE